MNNSQCICRVNLGCFKVIERLQNSFWGYVGWLGMSKWFQKIIKTKYWYNSCQNIEPKWPKIVENC